PEKPTPEQEARLKAAAESGTRLRGFRLGHRTATAQLGWLLQRGERAGFTIPAVHTATRPAPGLGSREETTPTPDVAVVRRDIERFRKKKEGRVVTVPTATFEGRLRVTDVEALRAALLTGIGPSKAYGCGLLTLAPLPAQTPEAVRG
ncbi:type I-E CRISPR-associated protein Cas6/Cse3/CasE, partial [Streptomyces sp. 8K308]|uniref:type I-E CRISPR-associated protein Cas6/Cse3/CasE n=1 Tax=Streptomyces sp. 8K308 TaxID=2530388 RepID=UPI0010536B57